MTPDDIRNRKKIIAAFRAAGYSDAQIAGVLGNVQVESGFEANGKKGDNGLAVGLFQMHPSYGSEAQRANPDWAIAAIMKEAMRVGFVPNGNQTVQEAATVWDAKVERSDGTARNERVAAAVQYQKTGLAALLSEPELTASTITVGGKVYPVNADGSITVGGTKFHPRSGIGGVIADVGDGVIGGIGDAAGGVADAAGSVVGVATSVPEFLGKVSSVALWKRVGVGALGVMLVLIAVAVLARNEVKGLIP